MAQGSPKPGEKYRHFKNKLYQIVAVAYHSETMERYVVYQALYGDFRIYIRPYDMFVSEVDHEKYPQEKQKYRFLLIEDEVKESAAAGEEMPEGVSPWLIRFLDAENFDKKYEIVCAMQRDIDDKLIDDISVVMDITIPEGDLIERYEQLKYCVRTRKHYEQNRLR